MTRTKRRGLQEWKYARGKEASLQDVRISGMKEEGGEREKRSCREGNGSVDLTLVT